MTGKRTNDTHRKHPHTMQEAFGPYTDNQLNPPARPCRYEPFARQVQDWALIVCLLLVIFTLGII